MQESTQPERANSALVVGFKLQALLVKEVECGELVLPSLPPLVRRTRAAHMHTVYLYMYMYCRNGQALNCYVHMDPVYNTEHPSLPSILFEFITSAACEVLVGSG